MMLRGRGFLGALLMVVGLFGWNLGLIGFLVWQGDRASLMGWGGVVLGALCTLTSFIWTAVTCSSARQKRLREHADRSYQLAMGAYLRDKLPEARVAVEAGLKGSSFDIDLLFLGWQLARCMGEPRQARKLLRRLRRADLEGKWDWEIEREKELSV